MTLSARRPTAVVGVAAVMLGLATVAHAQVTESFVELQGVLRDGEKLRVTEQSGVALQGSLFRLSDQSISLAIESVGPREVDESAVLRIERVHSNTTKGAVIGLVAGALTGALLAAGSGDNRGWGPSGSDFILPAAGLMGGIGAVVGALVGSTTSNYEVIYQAPGNRNPTARRSSPSNGFQELRGERPAR